MWLIMWVKKSTSLNNSARLFWTHVNQSLYKKMDDIIFPKSETNTEGSPCWLAAVLLIKTASFMLTELKYTSDKLFFPLDFGFTFEQRKSRSLHPSLYTVHGLNSS